MKYYLTTPIYYVNAAPHIGHVYTTIAADTIKRLKTMQGYEAVLTTGTDEHGQKIERAAKAAGQSPQEFTNVISEEFRQQWRTLGLDIDRFQRTSNPQHHQVVQDLFKRCLDKGHVYKGSYTGQYCVSCELYVNEAKPGDPCPDCGRPTETVTEENYFFRLSAFQDRLLELYEDQPDFILPETRRNEVLAFVHQGLSDLSISRTTIKWGIPLPVEGNHVFYVWFDALTTYKSAVEGEDLWPADLHLIGKEILRFHAIFWPAFLMAAGYELPKRIFAHGWLLFENDKMSKSRGNIVRGTPIVEVMGVDALRYFLLREVVFGKDGAFSYDALVQRYNADLANGLGNLASRTLSMIHQYRNGYIPDPGEDFEPQIRTAAVIDDVVAAYNAFDFSRALEAVWGLIGQLDQFIVLKAPWKVAKSKEENAQDQLDATLYTAAEALRIITVLIAPVVPQTAKKIWRLLGMPTLLDEAQFGELKWGQLLPGQRVEEVKALFPRLDAKDTIARMQQLETEETERQGALFGKTAAAAAASNDSEPVTAAAEPPPAHSPAPAAAPPSDEIGLTLSVESPVRPVSPGGTPVEETISIEDFAKIDLRVGVVRSAEPVKGADKLLHLKIDIGEAKPRTIVAGIAKAYTPEQMTGRKVVIVANLAPRKLRGIESQGMILAASLPDGPPVLAAFLEDIDPGARLK
jgi:methionyl-tRNA synthetase